MKILQAGGIVEPEPPESELQRIEEYLLADRRQRSCRRLPEDQRKR
jgi:hypothetical protein